MNKELLFGARFARLRASDLTSSIARTIGANGLITMFGALGGLLLTRGLGSAARGELGTIIVWPTVLGTILAFGLPPATCYLVARAPRNSGQLVTSALAISVLIGILGGFLGNVIVPAIAEPGREATSLRILFWALPIYLIPGVWIGSLQAIDNSAWNKARLVQPIFYFLSILILFLINRLTVESGVGVYLTSLFVQLIAAAWLAIPRLQYPFAVSLSLFGPLLRYGTKAVMADASWLVNARLDQLFLSVTVSASALGNYLAAVALTGLAAPAATAFGYVALPRIAQATTEHERKRLEQASIKGSIVASVLVLIPLGLLGSWLIPFLFGPTYDQAFTPLLVLVPATVAFLVNRVMGDVLRGRGKPGAPAIAEALAAVLTIGLLAILVPWWGITGAAITSLVAYSSATGVLLKSLKKHADGHGMALPLDLEVPP